MRAGFSVHVYHGKVCVYDECECVSVNTDTHSGCVLILCCKCTVALTNLWHTAFVIMLLPHIQTQDKVALPSQLCKYTMVLTQTHALFFLYQTIISYFLCSHRTKWHSRLSCASTPLCSQPTALSQWKHLQNLRGARAARSRHLNNNRTERVKTLR